jgi:alpha-D-ribose 1-methylphosphonate 5-triphosphate diphosphatase PhnM
MPDLVERVADHPLVRMVSLMDHSPGVGQYRDVERYRTMRIRQMHQTPEQVDRRIHELLDQRSRLREPQRAGCWTACATATCRWPATMTTRPNWWRRTPPTAS